MVIYLPAQAAEDTPMLDELTPREIVRGNSTEKIRHRPGRCEARRRHRSAQPHPPPEAGAGNGR